MADPGWVYLVHPETNGSGLFPDRKDVVDFYCARGWEPGVEPVDDEPEPEPAPQTDPPELATESRTNEAVPATESKE